MNFQHFCKWLKKELLSKLKSPCIITMDNAKYHKVEIDNKPILIYCKLVVTAWSGFQ
jgi:hypothetical protein